MRVSIGSDHRGVHLKSRVDALLREKGFDVDDVGTVGSESVDYPDFAAAVAHKVADGESDRGILICGTGIGMAIAANKVSGVRAAPCNDEHAAEMSRRHNDLNVLCISADLLDDAPIERLIDLWMKTPFEAGRHARRVEKISQIEHDAVQPVQH